MKVLLAIELMRKLLLSTWLLFALAAMSQPVQAQPRVALVVGVAQYVAAPALANPGNDSTDVAASLTRLGFETELVQDPDRASLEAALRRFGSRARGADAAVFYYAGHALEAGGRNWLLPRTANITSDRDLRFEAVDADLVLEQVEGAARVTVVLLDSCRDNPFRARIGGGGRSTGGGGGLAPPRAALGTLVGYSTAPGTVAEDGRGRNSPFTTALLRHMETPGLELRQLMGDVRRDVREATQGRQVPWEHSSLEGAFYLKPPAPPAAPAAAPRPSGTNTETLFWESMRGSADHRDFEAYLSQFPDGTFARLARNRLAQLGHPWPLTSDEVAAALGRAMIPAENTIRGATTFLGRPAAERAMAVNPSARAYYAPPGASDAEATRELTLERCEVHFGSPCALAMEGNTILPMAGTGPPWPVRSMPRAVYRGRFDPEQVPGRNAAGRRDPALQSYAAASLPKAAAYIAGGARFVAVTDAATETEAATRALQRCNEAPSRNESDGPCFLYALGDNVVLPQRLRAAPAASVTPARPNTPVAQAPATPAITPPTRLTSAQMVAALAPHVDAAATENATAFDGAPPHRVSVLNPARRGGWNGGGFATVVEAEEAVLERCQIFYDSPCAIFASGEAIRPAPPAGQAWPLRDMPRVRHAGRFSPGDVPGLSSAVRASQALQSYAAHRGAKAAAYHPWGHFFPVLDAATEAAAAEQALRICNDNPQRRGRNGPCFLYALGDNVVLPRRLRAAPAAPAATPPSPPAATRITAAQLTPVLTPLLGQPETAAAVSTFEGLRGPHRVMAVNLQRRRALNISVSFENDGEAAEAVMEICQVAHNSPCTLIVRGETLQPAPAAGQPWPVRDMPRARYAGNFSSQEIPGLSAVRRLSAPIQSYASHAGAKAAAFHVWGAGFFPITTAATETEAAEQALRLCNDNPERAGRDGPCFLYALGNRVVLPQRLTQPLR